ncbi:uncharacterized protein SPSK_02077 [Sporothrix schenckii 1099-18]|uniref:Uncharacterized protein n=1 Tax=Sporothrix schenckii 1099-18 TaxID=1397361 RepID=A0A0F2MB76_SPOSC|nr:uncharacterized protein SPSK_02077 [Sporothrix schenckii 1099-18]KJR86897.1 hypothetical protein SPSK_02077 [Sporothrix schenckii 1099-18]
MLRPLLLPLHAQNDDDTTTPAFLDFFDHSASRSSLTTVDHLHSAARPPRHTRSIRPPLVAKAQRVPSFSSLLLSSSPASRRRRRERPYDSSDR